MLAKRLDAAAEKITGRGVSETESEKWGTLADLLILELAAAASRANGVSSIPAFLTEVLRRKLLSGTSSDISKRQKTKPDTIGKPSASGEYEIKSLDEAGREAALVQLREFAGDEFLQDFKKWYTAEDWNWLIAELEKDKLAGK